MYEFHLPEFDGPLDLLLHLIEHRELDITRVSLAAVADQYLELISSPGVIEVSALADYLIIAAKLILIKSRLLLPQPEGPAPEGEEDLGEALARQLREYRKFKRVAAFLRERERQGLHTFARRAPPPRPQFPPRRLEGVSAVDLAQALQRALNYHPSMPQGTLSVPLAVSIEQKIETIVRLTTRRPRVRFSRLLERAETRVEIIVTFLAVLELIKRGKIRALQDRLFGEILLYRRDDDAGRAPQEPEGTESNYITE